MNINPKITRILCYGDSNTWGDPPDGSCYRYPVDVRWTGLLQKKLGDGFEIIEEGLCGRTTVLDDPKEEGRNGKTFLPVCLNTHDPVDIVLLMLGTNDLKERFNLSAEQIAKNIEELVQIIKQNAIAKTKTATKILLISPIHVIDTPPIIEMKGAEEKSKQFASFYKQVAERQNCDFIDMAQYTQPSQVDGLHLDKIGHAKVVEALTEKMQSIARIKV